MKEPLPPVPVSDNIFADLGIPNAQEELHKAQIAHAIRHVIEVSALTQAAAARQIGTTQPKVSRILGGKLAGFTSDRLLHYLRALECDIEIKITRKPANRSHGTLTVLCEL